MKIRNIIIEVFVGLLCIGLIIGIIFWQKAKNNKVADSKGEIEFIVVYKNDEKVIDDKIKFKEEDTLFSLLDRTYTLVSDNGAYGHTIYTINGYETDFSASYFSIMINGEYATTGIDGIELVDGEVIEFVWQEIIW